MRELWTVLKLDFKVLLQSFSFGGGKRRVGSAGALLLLGFLAVYLGGVYAFLLAPMLAQTGALDLLLPLMALMGMLASLAFTLFAASGLIFGGKDNDLMLSLPVPAFTVVLGKVLALYIENAFFLILWLVPSAVAYCMQSGAVRAGFALSFLVSLPFLPLLPTVLALLGGWLVALFTARMKRKTLVGNVVSILLFLAVMVGSFQLQNLTAMLLQNADKVRQAFGTWLLPMGWYRLALAGNFLALAGLLALCLLPFLAVAWAISTQYRAILSGMAGHAARGHYRLGTVAASGQFAALFRKECGRYFGSTIYFMNTGVGVIMAIGGCVYLAVARGSVAPYLEELGGAAGVAPMAAAILCLLLGMSCTTNSSISLEGKTLWILKEAPIGAGTLLGAKAAVTLMLTWPAALVCSALLAFALGLAPLTALALAAVTLAMGLWTALWGLWANLMLPKMDCPNDTIVVKQSAAAFVGMFGGPALVGLGALLYSPIHGIIGFEGFCLAAAAVLCAGCAVLWRWLITKGVRRLLAL